MDLFSSINLWLRGWARHVRPDNPLRRQAARAWGWFLERTTPTVMVPIGDMQLRLALRFRSMALDYERDTLQSFRRLLTPGEVVWDVGANLGIYTLIATQLVGEKGQVVSWEPSPPVFRYLQQHYAANGSPATVTLIPEAIHDGSVASVPFLLDLQDGFSSTGRVSSTLGQQTCPVPAAALDDWCDRLSRPPDVVKVDVEGAELFVLRGAARLMAGMTSRRPVFLLAVHPMFLPNLGCQPEQIPALLHERDYISLSVAGKPARPVEYNEYLLVPRERVEEVQARLHS
jgi:FkbM family methyltransferase